jgi:predicted nucleotidyltransferase
MAERGCNDHLGLLERLVASQGECVQDVIVFVQHAFANALAFDWNNAAQTRVVKYRISTFGSRVFGGELPSSDVDVVCELPSDCTTFRISGDILLQRFLSLALADPRCTSVKNAINSKHTVSFRFGGPSGLKVDVTFCTGSVELRHGPSRTTETIRKVLLELPENVRHLARLAVDAGKRLGGCFNGSGSVGNQLKAVHWVLLTVAWWRGFAADSSELAHSTPATLLHAFLWWLAFCNYEELTINALKYPYFTPRQPATGVPMWLENPLGDGGNLAGRINAEALEKFRTVLRASHDLLTNQPGKFWDDARWRWAYFQALAPYIRPQVQGRGGLPPLPPKAPPAAPPTGWC